MVEMCTDFEKDKISIVDDIDDCINTWCTKKRISKIILLEWKTTVFKQIVKETVELKNKSVHQKKMYKLTGESPNLEDIS